MPCHALSAGQRQDRFAALQRPVTERALQVTVADALVHASDRRFSGLPPVVGCYSVERYYSMFDQGRLQWLELRLDVE